MTTPGLTVRPATSSDVKPLAAVLARAFYDDPPSIWLLPEPRTRQARLRRVFATIMRAEALRHRTVEIAWAGDEIAGGTIWLPPGRWLPSLPAQLLSLPAYALALRRRLGSGVALTQALARVHPREPHWYLDTIGVDPAHQGHGVAGALLRSRLRRCDADGQPAYLESSKPANVPFYEHFGFEVKETPELPAGAPVITVMWRPPGGQRLTRALLTRALSVRALSVRAFQRAGRVGCGSAGEKPVISAVMAHRS
jgi:GNAT superfamily N-acetyltransferase